MPLFTNKVAAGSEFTGTTPDDGLFAPNPNIQQGYRVDIFSLRYHTTTAGGPGPTVSIYAQNPEDPADRTLIFASAALTDLYLESFRLPAVEGQSWPFVFETSGQTQDGYLSIDWDFRATRGI